MRLLYKDLQFVSFLVADGLEGADQVSDDLHPDVLGLPVPGHQVQLPHVCGRLENYREGRLLVKVLNLRAEKYLKIGLL